MLSQVRGSVRTSLKDKRCGDKAKEQIEIMRLEIRSLLLDAKAKKGGRRRRGIQFEPILGSSSMRGPESCVQHGIAAVFLPRIDVKRMNKVGWNQRL